MIVFRYSISVFCVVEKLKAAHSDHDRFQKLRIMHGSDIRVVLNNNITIFMEPSKLTNAAISEFTFAIPRTAGRLTDLQEHVWLLFCFYCFWS